MSTYRLAPMRTLPRVCPARRGRSAAMEDPFGTILSEAGAISSSQEEILRRSPFIRSARSPSSSSSSEGEESGLGAAAVRYRISDRPVTIRSASDSHHSPSSSSSPSSSDARGGGVGGGEVARPLEAVERPGAGDGGEGLGLPGNGGDGLLGSRGEMQSGVLKIKHSPEQEEAARTRKKRLRALSDKSTQQGEDSPAACSRGKLVARRLGFSGSDKEAAEPADRDGNPQTDRSVVEDESRNRSGNDEFARFRYVRTGVPPLRHSPPELLKGAHGSPKPACGGAPGVPQGMSLVAQDPADGEVVKSVNIGSPQEAAEGVMGLRKRSPSFRCPAGGERNDGSGTSVGFHGSPPLEAGPDTLVQLQNPVQPEVERPPGTGLGTSSPVEIPKQPEGQRMAERGPSGSAQSPAPPTENVPEGGTVEIRRPSDLVDLLLKFSKKPNKRFENVDFLEVLAMKGIHIPPPSWWRPGGYGPPKKKA